MVETEDTAVTRMSARGETPASTPGLREHWSAEGLFYLSAGPLAAIALGVALIPLRGLTSASNLSFAFMALTIVVAEFGGRSAAVATALVSALSLDFFLTQPYLRLSMEDKHDVIAFVGLAVCGLIAAALASMRGGRLAAMKAVQKHRDLLRSMLRGWNGADPIEPQLTRVLRAAREVFPLAGAVVRGLRGQVLASAAAADQLRAIPDRTLEPDMLLPETGSAREARPWTIGFPDEGGRIALASGGRQVGWLDVWGNGASASAESRRALSDLAQLMAVFLASADTAR